MGFRLCALLLAAGLGAAAASPTIEMPAETLRDKIRGGLLGQILGNLNGLPHEMKYIGEPGGVESYTPALPEGAWTDDDTDFEWVYVVTMEGENEIFLPPGRIARLWRERINRRIWCANRFARHLMDLGLEPPLTGNTALNPWAEFNVSGQFLAETFGLLAPGMPQTASRIGLNYTRVAIDGEPAQVTQFVDTMIATAFAENDLERVLDAGVAALDPRSRVREIVADARTWHREHPSDWRAARRLIRDKYTQAGGGMRDRNGHELNIAATVAALLYGGGDFARSLLAAFNFGWDCDNTAAGVGAILGVMRGYRWMMSQGWRIVDRYENRTRENMPADETITSFADRLADLAERVIAAEGGARVVVAGRPVYRIRLQAPASVAPLTAGGLAEPLRRTLEADIEKGLLGSADAQARARAAYLAIALDLFRGYQRDHPAGWKRAVEALSSHWKLLQDIYWDADIPLALPLRERAAAAGLPKPAARREVW